MTATAFLVDALTAALELGVATPADVLRHVTPEHLSAHLPRPLWARLITACLGAPRVDAQLVIDTIGIANLCAHVPAAVVWGCVAELGARALGGALPTAPATFVASAPVVPAAAPLAIGSPPPPAPRPVTPALPPGPAASVPLPSTLPSIEPRGELGDAQASLPTRARTPTSQRFRQAGTGLGRLGPGQRRPQAQASPPASGPEFAADLGGGGVDEIARHVRRGETEVEVVAPDVRPADDDELVDWPASESTATADVDDPKR